MNTQKIITIFRSRLLPGTEAAIIALGTRMYELASAIPGFISYKDFTAEDGENVAIIEFDSMESLAIWSANSEHLEAKERGRREFFKEYSIEICSILRQYGSNPPEGQS